MENNLIEIEMTCQGKLQSINVEKKWKYNILANSWAIYMYIIHYVMAWGTVPKNHWMHSVSELKISFSEFRNSWRQRYSLRNGNWRCTGNILKEAVQKLWDNSLKTISDWKRSYK